MTPKALECPEKIGPSQTFKIQHVFQLLEDNLQPEERDKASPAYRLGWYDHLQACSLGREDLEHFRRFVDEMAERALKRSYRTEVLFPSGPSSGFSAENVDFNVLRARELCESLHAGRDES